MKKRHAEDATTVSQAADAAKFLAKAGGEVVVLGALTAAEVVVGAAELAVSKIAFSEKTRGHKAAHQ
jgi:methylmalonyl-CoA mutase cobalamin-binding subunit